MNASVRFRFHPEPAQQINESEALLAFLLDHTEKVEFQIRLYWDKERYGVPGQSLHRAQWDYRPAERKGNRVTIKGDQPS